MAERLEEGCLRKGSEGGEGGFQLGRPGFGVDQFRCGYCFLGFGAICILN